MMNDAREESRKTVNDMDVEQQLLNKLKNGDHSALRSLMESYGNAIMRTAFLLLKDRHLAEDVSQEVFITAYQKIHQFRAEGALRGWLLQITVNCCRSKMRRMSWKKLWFRDKVDECERLDIQEAAVAIAPQLEPGTDAWVNSWSLRSAIEQLSLPYREVVVLYYYHELRTREIAEVLREPEGTVKSKLLRARRQLRHLLEEGENFDGRS